jgi:hypothetical protein
VRELAKCPRPAPGLLERWGLRPAAEPLKLRIQ